MSRCFGFPPPGYVWSLGGDALQEMLKIRTEHFKALNEKKIDGKRAKKYEKKRKRIDKNKIKYETSLSENNSTISNDTNKPTSIGNRSKTSENSQYVSKSKKCRVTLQYEQLMENWAPPLMESKAFDVGSDDEEWFLRSKLSRNDSIRAENSEIRGNDLPPEIPEVHSCPTLLPEINTYALPYVVPF